MKNIQVIEDMKNSAYHKGDWQSEYISSTQLKSILVSPMYFDWVRKNGKQISQEAQLTGSVYHSMLESINKTGAIDDIWEEFFLFDAPINPKTDEPYGINTKAFQFAYNQAIEENGGKTPIDQNTIDKCSSMISVLVSKLGSTSTLVERFLQNGKSEVSFFLEEDDLKLKCRTDLITNNFIVDWKTIASDDLHEKTILNQIMKMEYHFSAAMYQYIIHQVTGVWREFMWVFQQKSEPFDAVVVSSANLGYYEDSNGLQKGVGAIMFEDALNALKTALKEKTFKGAEIFIEPDRCGNRVMYPQPKYLSNNIFYQDNNNTNSK